jgi:hypothetical protein
MGDGFDLTCRADLDQDGTSAVFKTTSEVAPLSVSEAGVR